MAGCDSSWTDRYEVLSIQDQIVSGSYSTLIRCTQDTSTIDDELALMSSPLISVTIDLICLFFAAVIMVGWYALIPGLVVAILGGFLGRVYLKCQICIRREMRYVIISSAHRAIGTNCL